MNSCDVMVQLWSDDSTKLTCSSALVIMQSCTQHLAALHECSHANGALRCSEHPHQPVLALNQLTLVGMHMHVRANIQVYILSVYLICTGCTVSAYPLLKTTRAWASSGNPLVATSDLTRSLSMLLVSARMYSCDR